MPVLVSPFDMNTAPAPTEAAAREALRGSLKLRARALLLMLPLSFPKATMEPVAVTPPIKVAK
jgi:hypothetical protein